MEKREITEEQALQRLAGLCSRGEYCSYDMTEKMRRWGLSETAQARVMAELVKGRQPILPYVRARQTEIQ